MSRIWMAMLAVVSFCFKPLIGGLIYQNQIEVKQTITSQEEKDKYQESQHEDDPRKCQKEMLDDKKWSSGLLYALLINVVSVQESSSQNSLEQHVCCKDCDIPCHGTNTEEVQHKVSCVLGTNAVVHPHTVMVKSLDTSIANTTVFGAGRFDQLTG